MTTYTAMIAITNSHTTAQTFHQEGPTTAKQLVRVLRSTIADQHHPEIRINRDDGQAIGWNLLKQLAAAE